jgi:hypothetical protein
MFVLFEKTKRVVGIVDQMTFSKYFTEWRDATEKCEQAYAPEKLSDAPKETEFEVVRTKRKSIESAVKG